MNMKSLLMENFGFPENHIKVLTNGAATRTGILSAMKQDVIDKAGRTPLLSSTTPGMARG
jgi:hypothetical protein